MKLQTGADVGAATLSPQQARWRWRWPQTRGALLAVFAVAVRLAFPRQRLGMVQLGVAKPFLAFAEGDE